MILIPFVFAIFVPLLYKYFNKRLHTGWFVILIPIIIFVYLLQLIPKISSGATIYETIPWIPSFGINLDMYVDGLSLIFGLLITGIGALVILYSIYYLSKEKEALHNFYVYLLLLWERC